MKGAKSSMIGRAVWLLRSRPLKFFATLRCYLLFQKSRFFASCFPSMLDGILLAENVRVQRLACFSCERPDALIRIGANSIIYENARIEAYGTGRVEIGECSILGDIRIYSRKNVQIGKRFLSSWNVFIQDYDPHPVSARERATQVLQMVESFRPGVAVQLSQQNSPVPIPEGQQIIIGDDVWVGAGVVILKGAKIGSGCIVAAGAVVLRGNYPDNSLIAGNPARVVKSLGQEDVPESRVRSGVSR